MKNVRIGGVPEHFNYAWYLALKQGHFKQHNIEVRWKDYFGGTGQMTKALRQDSRFKDLNSLKGQRAAISRYGSGSHLMAYVNAMKLKWNTASNLEFKVVKDLNGAVESLSNKKADYFMWEKFTTKPFVDQKIFRHLGDCLTPWPCFVIAVRDEFIINEKETLQIILKTINTITTSFKEILEIDRIISERYQQKNEDVKEWLKLTEWSQKNIDPNTVEAVQNQLLQLNIISEKWTYDQLVTNL